MQPSKEKYLVAPVLLPQACLANHKSIQPSDCLDQSIRNKAGSVAKDNPRTSPEPPTKCHTDLTTMDADSSTGSVRSQLLLRKQNLPLTECGITKQGMRNISIKRTSPILRNEPIKAESPSSTTTERNSPVMSKSSSNLVSTTTGLLRMTSDNADEYQQFDGNQSPLSSSASSNKRSFTNSRERWR